MPICFFDYATFLAVEPSLERLVKAKEYLEKALSLFKSSGSLDQKYIDETKEVITNIQSWLSNYSGESTAEETESDDVKKAFKVKYQNLELQTRIKTYTGWTAQIIQHEIDHCNGILI